MNFNLKQSQATSKKSKPKASIGFGLNTRGNKTSVIKKKKSNSIFAQDDSSSGDESDNKEGGDGRNSAKSNFNRELLAEQKALRARAQKAMATSSSANKDMYNYDAEYESFSSGLAIEKSTQRAANEAANKAASIDPNAPPPKKQSRYIQGILQKSKERNMEREIVLERKIAREQREEDSKLEIEGGTEKFVTGAYKRKLEEREKWYEKQKVDSKREEEDDVTKKVGGTAMMGFYGNLSRISTGTGGNGNASESKCATHKEEQKVRPISAVEKPARQGINESESARTDGNASSQHGHATTSNESYSQQRRRRPDEYEYNPNGNVEEVEIDQEMRQQKERVERLQKIFKARDRYLQRLADKRQIQ